MNQTPNRPPSYAGSQTSTPSGSQPSASPTPRSSFGESYYYKDARMDRALAYLVLRLALGLSVMLHGMVRLSIYTQFINETTKQFAPTFLPPASVHLLAYTLPFIESAIGFLVLIGAATRYALFVGGLFMLVLLFGMNILQQWAIVEIQLVYVLLYFLLLAFREWNDYSVDGLIGNKQV